MSPSFPKLWFNWVLFHIYQGREEQLFYNTCTDGPIPFVARPTRAVIRAKSVNTACFYVTVMNFALTFINVW